jgi:GlpG protein
MDLGSASDLKERNRDLFEIKDLIKLKRQRSEPDRPSALQTWRRCWGSQTARQRRGAFEFTRRFLLLELTDMRLIGHLSEETAAQTFADYLYVQGIQNHIEHEKETGYGVWVSDEDLVGRATELLKEFQGNPKDAKYRTEAKNAADKRDQAQKDEEAYRRKLRNRKHLFRPLTPYGFGPLTFVMIVASLAVFAWSTYGHDMEPLRNLFMTGSTGAGIKALPEIRHGEFWRLFTPMFIHWSWIHIICNMLWLRDLGSMIEGRQSSLHLLVIALVIAGLSNLGQFYMSGPSFGGMSGVVYGLLGYIWIRGRFDPASGLYLHSSTVTMMLIWFFLCIASNFFPMALMPNIANTAHAVGLGTGMAWGYLSSLKYRKG